MNIFPGKKNRLKNRLKRNYLHDKRKDNIRKELSKSEDNDRRGAMQIE